MEPYPWSREGRMGRGLLPEGDEHPTIVAIGCSTHWDYALLVPVACLLWKEVVGHSPVALLVGSEAEWKQTPLTSVALDAIRELGSIGVGFEHIPTSDRYDAGTLAQSVRQHYAAASHVRWDQWVTVSDADLFPLKRDFYHQHDGRDEPAVCYFANGDCFQGKEEALSGWAAQRPFQSIPTCHVVMRATTWRELYGYGVLPREPEYARLGHVAAALYATLDRKLLPRLEGKDPRGRATEAWYFDQYYLTERLCRQEWFSDRALLVPRTSQTERGHLVLWELGGGWQEGIFDPSWVDVHVRHGVYDKRRWLPLLDAIRHALPSREAWARDYFERATQHV